MSKKFSDAQRERILADAREHLAHRPEPYTPPGEPRKDRLTRWQHEQEEAEQRFARETAASEGPLRRIAMLEQQLADTLAWMRTEIDQRVTAERTFLLEVVGSAMGELREMIDKDAENELNDGLRELRVDLSRLQQTLFELKQTIIAGDRSSKGIVELPPLPLRTVN